jgi:beta-N-acetylhexosaminidase
VRALEAGADTLLMPTDPDAAIRAVVAAVESGRLSRRRVQESVAKILAAKEKLGLDRKRLVDVEAIGDVIDSPEANQRAQEIARRAVTLVRNTGNMIPLANPDRACYVTMAEGRYSTEGQAFTAEVRKRAKAASVTALDASMLRADLDAALQKLAACDSYAVAAFSTVGAYRGSVGLGGDLPHVIESLGASGKPLALVALGNPYLLRAYTGVTSYLATFSTVPPSEIAAVEALWGEVRISGHLPVGIPGQAKLGDGITVEATRPPVSVPATAAAAPAGR